MPTATTPTRLLLPLLAAAFASACWVSMDATIKSMGPRYGAVQLTFFRFAAGSVFAVALWLWFRSPMPVRSQWRWHVLRSALLLVTLTSYVHALRLLPLAQAVAIGYTAPIFIALLAMWLLRERPSRWIWLSLALGVAGAAVALAPALVKGQSTQVEGLLAAAFSAVAFSGVMVLARHQAQRDALWTILLLQNLLPAAGLALVVGLSWQPLHTDDVPTIGLVGLFATFGLLGLTYAFQHLEASRVAPVEYTGFLFAGVLGYIVFGEVPTLTTALSAALIVTGCLLLLRR